MGRNPWKTAHRRRLFELEAGHHSKALRAEFHRPSGGGASLRSLEAQRDCRTSFAFLPPASTASLLPLVLTLRKSAQSAVSSSSRSLVTYQSRSPLRHGLTRISKNRTPAHPFPSFAFLIQSSSACARFPRTLLSGHVRASRNSALVEHEQLRSA